MAKELIKEADMLRVAEYQKELYKKPELRFLFLELTDKCNLNCAHCGSKCTANNNTYLPFYAVEKALTSVAGRLDPAKTMVCITGGEPLLSKDLLKVIRLAHGLGFFVGMTTNGTLIDDKVAYQLAVAGIDTVTISIDGLGSIHDDFRRSKGCFDKAMRGIKALQKVGIEPEVLTVVHKGNICELEDIFEFLKNEEIYSWRLTNVEPIGRAAVNDDVMLSSEALKRLYGFVREKRFDKSNDMEVSYGCSHFLGMEYEKEIRDYYFQCGAGTRVASVMANGDIGACLDIERRSELIQGNVYIDDFMEVWEEKFKEFRQNRAEKSEVCRNCEHKKICRGDSAHTWNYDENRPNYCVVKMMEDGKDEDKYRE